MRSHEGHVRHKFLPRIYTNNRFFEIRAELTQGKPMHLIPIINTGTLIGSGCSFCAITAWQYGWHRTVCTELHPSYDITEDDFVVKAVLSESRSGSASRC